MPSLDAGGGPAAAQSDASTADTASVAPAKSSVKNGGDSVEKTDQDISQTVKETESGDEAEKKATEEEAEKEEERLKDVNNDLEMSSDEDSRQGSDIEEWPADKPKVQLGISLPVPVLLHWLEKLSSKNFSYDIGTGTFFRFFKHLYQVPVLFLNLLVEILQYPVFRIRIRIRWAPGSGSRRGKISTKKEEKVSLKTPKKII
jgi:hypothetical protein